jgi:hypothetical protein
MGAIVIRTRFDEVTESAEVATSVISPRQRIQSMIIYIFLVMTCTQNATVCIQSGHIFVIAIWAQFRIGKVAGKIYN